MIYYTNEGKNFILNIEFNDKNIDINEILKQYYFICDNDLLDRVTVNFKMALFNKPITYNSISEFLMKYDKDYKKSYLQDLINLDIDNFITLINYEVDNYDIKDMQKNKFRLSHYNNDFYSFVLDKIIKDKECLKYVQNKTEVFKKMLIFVINSYDDYSLNRDYKEYDYNDNKIFEIMNFIVVNNPDIFYKKNTFNYINSYIDFNLPLHFILNKDNYVNHKVNLAKFNELLDFEHFLIKNNQFVVSNNLLVKEEYYSYNKNLIRNLNNIHYVGNLTDYIKLLDKLLSYIIKNDFYNIDIKNCSNEDKISFFTLFNQFLSNTVFKTFQNIQKLSIEERSNLFSATKNIFNKLNHPNIPEDVREDLIYDCLHEEDFLITKNKSKTSEQDNNKDYYSFHKFINNTNIDIKDKSLTYLYLFNNNEPHQFLIDKFSNFKIKYLSNVLLQNFSLSKLPKNKKHIDFNNLSITKNTNTISNDTYITNVRYLVMNDYSYTKIPFFFENLFKMNQKHFFEILSSKEIKVDIDYIPELIRRVDEQYENIQHQNIVNIFTHYQNSNLLNDKNFISNMYQELIIIFNKEIDHIATLNNITEIFDLMNQDFKAVFTKILKELDFSKFLNKFLVNENLFKYINYDKDLFDKFSEYDKNNFITYEKKYLETLSHNQKNIIRKKL